MDMDTTVALIFTACLGALVLLRVLQQRLAKTQSCQKCGLNHPQVTLILATLPCWKEDVKAVARWNHGKN